MPGWLLSGQNARQGPGQSLKHSVAHITSQHTFSFELTDRFAEDASNIPANVSPNLIFRNFRLASCLAFELLLSLL